MSKAWPHEKGWLGEYDCKDFGVLASCKVVVNKIICFLACGKEDYSASCKAERMMIIHISGCRGHV